MQRNVEFSSNTGSSFEKTDILREICRFISYTLADLWFTDQIYNAGDYQKLCNSLRTTPKTLNTANKFWNPESSILTIPRTGIQVPSLYISSV